MLRNNPVGLLNRISSRPDIQHSQYPANSYCLPVRYDLLRYEMQTNKELVAITDQRDNTTVWNRYLEEEKLRGQTCRYYYYQCWEAVKLFRQQISLWGKIGQNPLYKVRIFICLQILVGLYVHKNVVFYGDSKRLVVAQ